MPEEPVNERTHRRQSPFPDSAVEGRTYNSGNPAYEDGFSSRDISSVDQQEGNMHHGELGGCFEIEPEQEGQSRQADESAST